MTESGGNYFAYNVFVKKFRTGLKTKPYTHAFDRQRATTIISITKSNFFRFAANNIAITLSTLLACFISIHICSGKIHFSYSINEQKPEVDIMMSLLALKPSLFSDCETKQSVTLHSADNSVIFCKKTHPGENCPLPSRCMRMGYITCRLTKASDRDISTYA